MSRTWTQDELRSAYAYLKKQGLSQYDYDELKRIDSQGRLLMTTDVANASKAACEAIRDAFPLLASFQIVALNCKSTGDDWLDKAVNAYKGPYTWALYLEIDDDADHEDLFLDGYDAVKQHIPEVDDILSVAAANGVDISKQNVHADIRGRQSWNVSECDGGGAVGGAGGDAGGAAAAPAASGDAGDIAEEMAGTTSAEVLGTNEPGKGFFGTGNFYIPARAKHPLHRWECANGGSKRKKGKNGKPMKTPYEKDMKVVVSMFEDEQSEVKHSKKQIQDAIAYWQKQLDLGNYK